MNHIPDELLSAFVEGDVDETVASHIAEHIDSCAACLARASAEDPLAAVLAQVADPPPPPDLTRRILERADRPDVPLVAPEAALPILAPAPGPRFPWSETAVGLGLLGAAGALAVAGDADAWSAATDPASALSRAGVLLGMLHGAGQALRVGLGADELGLVLAAVMTVAGLLTTARLALSDSPLTGSNPQEGVA